MTVDVGQWTLKTLLYCLRPVYTMISTLDKKPHTDIASVSELLCLIPILVGSSIATVCPPERDTALRTSVTTITRVPQ